MFKTNNQTRLQIDSSGNVGIGINTPCSALHIEATDAIKLPKGTTAERPYAYSRSCWVCAI